MRKSPERVKKAVDLDMLIVSFAVLGMYDLLQLICRVRLNNSDFTVNNLTSWQKGQSGNPAGRPKGSKNWSAIVKNLLENKEVLDVLIKKKLFIPLEGGYEANSVAEEIGIVMILKAIGGDIKAAEWLRRTAYGDKIDIYQGDDVQNVALVEFIDYPHHRSFRTQEENDAHIAASNT